MITSASNERLKRVAALRDKKHRLGTQSFLVEGVRELSRALYCGYELLELYWSGENWQELQKHPEWQGQKLAANSVVTVAPSVFHKIAMREQGAGVVAVLRAKELGSPEDLIKNSCTLFVLDAVEKPGNVGAILRSLDGAGVDGLLICNDENSYDLYNPNAIRASVGALFKLPIVVAPTVAIHKLLQAHNFKTVMATPEAKQLYHQVKLSEKVAVVLGSEAHGVGIQWREQSVLPISLPMHGIGDSLNVSVTAAILAYEILRQRAVS